MLARSARPAVWLSSPAAGPDGAAPRARGRGHVMVRWGEFAATAPTLAHTGRALLTQFGPGLAFLATVRGDGAPRVHPVCPVLSGDRLFVLIAPDSPKLGDL